MTGYAVNLQSLKIIMLEHEDLSEVQKCWFWLVLS